MDSVPRWAATWPGSHDGSARRSPRAVEGSSVRLLVWSARRSPARPGLHGTPLYAGPGAVRPRPRSPPIRCSPPSEGTRRHDDRFARPSHATIAVQGEVRLTLFDRETFLLMGMDVLGDHATGHAAPAEPEVRPVVVLGQGRVLDPLAGGRIEEGSEPRRGVCLPGNGHRVFAKSRAGRGGRAGRMFARSWNPAAAFPGAARRRLCPWSPRVRSPTASRRE